MSEEINKATRGKKSTKPDNKNNSGATGYNNDNKVLIEVSKYKSILKLLDDPKKTWRVLIAIFFIGVVLFTGIAVVASAIKKVYPYSDITTNALGATTIKSEKKEVSYWLYNTSQLWANSGISVNEGDVLTIRSSGQFYTAIHHLFDSAEKNLVLKDRWVGSGGEEDSPSNMSEGSFYRRKFRMFPNLPTGTLVMQVAHNNPYDTPREEGANPEDFYFIGKERQNIYIKNPGTVYFSLNDIVLNKRTILELLLDCLKDTDAITEELLTFYQDNPISKEKLYHRVEKVKEIGEYYQGKELNDFIADADACHAKVDAMFTDFATIFGDKILVTKKGGRAMGKYKLGVTELVANSIAGNRLDFLYILKDTLLNKIVLYSGDTVTRHEYIGGQYTIQSKSIIKTEAGEEIKSDISVDNPILISKHPKLVLKKYFDVDKLKRDRYKSLVTKKEYHILLNGVEKVISDTVRVCEMEYYLKNDYKTAWFDDNIGSFLIVIEKDSK